VWLLGSLSDLAVTVVLAGHSRKGLGAFQLCRASGPAGHGVVGL
jgi:hypothetical protein